jgi:hypothetical protein
MKLRNVLLDRLHRNVGVGRPSYTYRNLPALAKENPQAWFISGYDKYNEKRGILEWCHDEQDARTILARMLKYPRQFEAIHTGAYGNIDWLRTNWDNHY